MKQLLILSGKGGTGKTTVAGAFIRLNGCRAFADCDVDAPNLHLILGGQQEPERQDYYGMPRAQIDQIRCTGCGRCAESCRFDALIAGETDFHVRLDYCEGCGVCVAVCPAGAIELRPFRSGELRLFAEGSRVFSAAKLQAGSGASGKLVTAVKEQLTERTPPDTALAIIDGSPGIGCPVIASMKGVDMVLIVAEPSVSGISDLERIVETARLFETKAAVCINKSDTNPAASRRIEDFCRENRLPLAGRIPFDPMAVRAVNSGLTIADIDCRSGHAVKEVFKNTMRLLEGVAPQRVKS